MRLRPSITIFALHVIYAISLTLSPCFTSRLQLNILFRACLSVIKVVFLFHFYFTKMMWYGNVLEWAQLSLVDFFCIRCNLVLTRVVYACGSRLRQQSMCRLIRVTAGISGLVLDRLAVACVGVRARMFS